MKTEKSVLHIDRLIAVFALLIASLLPFEQIVSHFKLNETSIFIKPLTFNTVLLGYESNSYLIIVLLTGICYGFPLFSKWYFFEFLIVLIGIVYIILISLMIMLNFHHLEIGFFLCLVSSGYLIFNVIKGLF